MNDIHSSVLMRVFRLLFCRWDHPFHDWSAWDEVTPGGCSPLEWRECRRCGYGDID